QIKPGGDHLTIVPISANTQAGASFSVTVQELEASGSLVKGDTTTQVQLSIQDTAGNQITQTTSAAANNVSTVSLQSVSGLLVDMVVTGQGIPANTFINSIDRSANSITLSGPVTVASGVSLTFDPTFLVNGSPATVATGTMTKDGFVTFA